MGTAVELAGTTWPECGSVAGTRDRPIADPRGPLLLVPTGSVEQHGPHLPLGVDAMVADAVAHGVAARLDAAGRRLGPARGWRGTQVFVGPPVNYGASGEHEGFPGTVSIGQLALSKLLLELGRSACRWAGTLVFVNGHGGNTTSLVRAVTRLRAEGRTVAWVPCSAGGDAHAGRTETSLMLALAPWLVRDDLAERGNVAPVGELIERLRREGVSGVSANGVLGDPAGASQAEGRRLIDRMVDRTAALIATFDAGPDGRLRPVRGAA